MIHHNKGHKLPPEPLNQTEWERLLAACRDGRHACRNEALIALMHGAGLRCAEALSIREPDFDPDQGTIRVLRGKGRKCRVVGASAHVVAAVRGWLRERSLLLPPPDAPIICREAPGCPALSLRQARTILQRLGRRAGLVKRTHCHGLRHTCAVELLAEGVPLAVISRGLGHSNLATTARYLDHISPVDVVQYMRSR